MILPLLDVKSAAYQGFASSNLKINEEEKRKPMDILKQAEDAIDALNLAAITMHRQMKSKQLDKSTANKLILAAQKKAKAANDAYFSRKQLFGQAAEERFRELLELSQSGLIEELQESNDKFNKVLKHYMAAVGGEVG